MDMCIDMCTDMCMGMCMDMCMGMCMGMCMDMCMDMCMHLHTDIRLDMCIDMCMEICLGICTDTYAIMSIDRAKEDLRVLGGDLLGTDFDLVSQTYRDMYGQASGHVYTEGHGSTNRRAWYHITGSWLASLESLFRRFAHHLRGICLAGIDN